MITRVVLRKFKLAVCCRVVWLGGVQFTATRRLRLFHFEVCPKPCTPDPKPYTLNSKELGLQAFQFLGQGAWVRKLLDLRFWPGLQFSQFRRLSQGQIVGASRICKPQAPNPKP